MPNFSPVFQIAVIMMPDYSPPPPGSMHRRAGRASGPPASIPINKVFPPSFHSLLHALLPFLMLFFSPVFQISLPASISAFYG